jgi:hypothetical protein
MDNELREALRRKQAPVDLADRVLARARQSSARATVTPINEQARHSGATSSGSLRRGLRLGRRNGGQVSGQGVRRWLAAAAVLAVAAGGAERYYTQQKAAESARVQEEIRIALQITSNTLAVVQSKLSQPADNGSR